LHPRGTIFHHYKLVFHNGHTGNKFLILLNTPNIKEPYLFVKTTSKKKNKSKTIGCQKKDGLFFIPGGKTFFPNDTWVQLYEIYPMTQKQFNSNKDIKKVGDMSVGAIDEIVKCLLKTQSEDLSPKIKVYLQPPMQDSLEKLKTHFNKKF
jgi:hypothetical protein